VQYIISLVANAYSTGTVQRDAPSAMGTGINHLYAPFDCPSTVIHLIEDYQRRYKDGTG
jgi:hypothetical protein